MSLLLALLWIQDPVPDLIEKLGSDSVEDRERATTLLEEMAEDARGPLKEAARSSDPERAARAREILDSLLPFQVMVTWEMLSLQVRARSSFEDRDFGRTLAACDRMLEIDPFFGLALRLREETCSALDHPELHPQVPASLEPWQTREDPALYEFRLPSRRDWAAMLPDLRALEPSDQDHELLAIHRKLQTMKVDLAFENTKLIDILEFIRDFSGLNLVMDAGMAAGIRPEQTLTFKVKDETVGKVLDRLLKPMGLTYTITPELVVLLTTPAKAAWPFPHCPLQESARRARLP